MTFMAWNKDMSVDVGVIDEDHKKLVNLVNEMHEAMRVGKGKEAIQGVLGQLVDYTKLHFAREEAFFDKTNYGQAFAHKMEHGALIKQVTEFQKKYTSGTVVGLSLEIMEFLKSWLLHHIMEIDKKYVAHFHAHGIH